MVEQTSKNSIFFAIIIGTAIIAGAIIYVSQGKGEESSLPVSLEETGPAALNLPEVTQPSEEGGEPSETSSIPSLNDFAQCLSETGVKFYGAEWCGHCKHQKELFGEAMEYVNYIECADSAAGGWSEVCQEAEITAVPTWVFADGQRQMGVQSLEKLAQLSGCSL